MMPYLDKMFSGSLFHYFFMGLICVALAVFVYVHDIAELRQQYVSGKETQQRLAMQSKALNYRQMLLEEEVAQFNEVKVVLKEWQNKFIKYRDLNKLVKEIRTMGRMNKLNFSLFKPGQGVQENDYIKQPFYVVVTGNYVQTAQFIKQIAKLPWIVIIGNFTVSRVLQTNTIQPLSTEIELDVYYMGKEVNEVKLS